MATETAAPPTSPVAEALDGRRLFVTGTTGFLGTALVERLLRCAPGCHLVLLVRPGRKRTVEQRAQREIFRNDCFDRLRDEVGGKEAFDALVAERVTVVAGDVATDGLGLDAAGREALAACDTVIHSAATVSFDSPLDLAVEVNLLGPSRIALTLADLGRGTPPGRGVHLLRGRQPAGRGARDPGRRQPLLDRRRPPARGRGRPSGAGRRRGGQPLAREPAALPGRGRRGAGRGRHPPAGREDRVPPQPPG